MLGKAESLARIADQTGVAKRLRYSARFTSRARLSHAYYLAVHTLLRYPNNGRIGLPLL